MLIQLTVDSRTIAAALAIMASRVDYLRDMEKLAVLPEQKAFFADTVREYEIKLKELEAAYDAAPSVRNGTQS